MLVSLDSDDVGLDIQNCYLFLKIRHATEEARANKREGERAKKGTTTPCGCSCARERARARARKRERRV